MNAGGQERRVIDGRFELLGRLGAGGMGMVWRALDLALHREVALKEVRPPDPALLAADPAAARLLRERVLREARALARIDHPAVVTIHHIVDSPEMVHPWIVMELVAGQSLQERLAEGTLTPVEAATIGRGVLAALHAAHAADIHHRDVKPANVLLRPDGRPVLTDFGIAALREATGLTATGDLIGSPDYIAPERIRGDESRTASDLWSLGMLMYVSVEGRHPLRRATSLATLAAVLDEEIPAPVRAGALAPVLMALLDRDPDARPDAAELDRLLTAVVDGPGSAPGEADAVVPEKADAVTPHQPPQQPPPTPATRVLTPPSRYEQRPASPYSGFPSSANLFTPPASPAPRGSASGPGPVSGTGAPARLAGGARRPPFVPIAAAVVGVGLTGVLIWALLPSQGDKGGDGNTPGADRPGTSAPADPSPRSSESSDPVTSPQGSDEESLLTPSGVRAVIGKLKPVMGGTEVSKFSLYSDHASADALIAGSKELYDSFDYRDGQVTKRDMGGTLPDGEGTVDLLSFDWDALPGLFSKAEKDLGVDKPTNRYIFIDPSWAFADDQPVLLVYLSDNYGGAYLAADRSGKVLKKYARGD
ncbi:MULTISPECIES: serine/threonine-protein kinase [unclassified Streptomyces]|uniref:serine/threonine-protein kinase n=1 Tax=unclassified Streptomyces TaxID=2593676 RepID=UPI000B839891|nr:MULTISPECIES: serine/threonine-protein kinase [unclassified Streptomyces]MYZ39117.1 protein kinase [Streptomyces sp. SID4917]